MTARRPGVRARRRAAEIANAALDGALRQGMDLKADIDGVGQLVAAGNITAATHLARLVAEVFDGTRALEDSKAAEILPVVQQGAHALLDAVQADDTTRVTRCVTELWLDVDDLMAFT